MSVRHRAGRGTLFIVAMLFATSGALRLGSGVGVALARTESQPEVAGATVEPALCETPTALSEALKLREGRVAVQEAALQDRLAALALADAAISERMVESTFARSMAGLSGMRGFGWRQSGLPEAQRAPRSRR